jgi:hypothetical protein
MGYRVIVDVFYNLTPEDVFERFKSLAYWIGTYSAV